MNRGYSQQGQQQKPLYNQNNQYNQNNRNNLNQNELLNKVKQLEYMNQMLMDKISNLENKKSNDEELNNFGEEDFGMINNQLLRKLIFYPTRGLLELFRYIYFNNKNPKNRILTIKRNDHNTVYYYQDKQWKHIRYEDMLGKILNKLVIFFDKYYENFVKKSETAEAQQIKFKYGKWRDRLNTKDSNLLIYYSLEFKLTMIE